MQLNYNHLRYFWAVAHEGNLTRAARRLHVSQSAVSVQIKKLERELGHDLFERRGKRLELTEAGRIALDHADAIFTIGDELVGTLDDHAQVVRVLRVGAIATLSRNFQLGLLQPLLGRDDVELVVRSGTPRDLLASLETHRLDVVLANIVPARDGESPWVAHAIAAQPVSLVGPPKRGRRRRQRPLEQLLAEEPLILPPVESSIRVGFDALVARLDIRPKVAAEVDDMAMLRLLARAQVGLAVVPSVVVKDEIAQGILVEIETIPGLEETFFAITLDRRFPNPLVRDLIAERDPAVWAPGGSPFS